MLLNWIRNDYSLSISYVFALRKALWHGTAWYGQPWNRRQTIWWHISGDSKWCLKSNPGIFLVWSKACSESWRQWTKNLQLWDALRKWEDTTADWEYQVHCHWWSESLSRIHQTFPSILLAIAEWLNLPMQACIYCAHAQKVTLFSYDSGLLDFKSRGNGKGNSGSAQGYLNYYRSDSFAWTW